MYPTRKRDNNVMMCTCADRDIVFVHWARRRTVNLIDDARSAARGHLVEMLLRRQSAGSKLVPIVCMRCVYVCLCALN